MHDIATEWPWIEYSDSLRAARSGDRIPVKARFSAVWTPGHWGPPSLFPGRGVVLTTQSI